MPNHYFRITNCDGGTIEYLAEIADVESAWTETTKVFGDLARGCGLKENAEWRIELLGPARQPLYRIRLLAETCETVATMACLAADTSEPY
ncbi:hypothetical protein PMI42_01951 [Bradyrhizobium sp. YR681]|uniref:hypothetical protein n=1 Tax=Bradyrhizobium sp. YR681 TaxID=1144344 RepID=UPI000270DF20|nr:hypothetical protein [Bradyrhizobium sp. YR681]EJN14481.1 hypothetical protein PMI42_01951 [Bradyrhizobium sp. YR681]